MTIRHVKRRNFQEKPPSSRETEVRKEFVMRGRRWDTKAESITRHGRNPTKRGERVFSVKACTERRRRMPEESNFDEITNPLGGTYYARAHAHTHTYTHICACARGHSNTYGHIHGDRKSGLVTGGGKKNLFGRERRQISSLVAGHAK